jgi:tetratricopeptide (TPR) repeat protein
MMEKMEKITTEDTVEQPGAILSQNTQTMMDYYTKDIGDDEREAYLQKLLEEVRDEIQTSFIQEIKHIYSPRVDIQQRMVLPDSVDREELDFFARKLLLMDRAGVKLDLDVYLPLALYFLLGGYYPDGLDLLIRNLDLVEDTEYAINMLAVIFYKNGNKDESLNLLEDAIKRGAQRDIIFYNTSLLNYMIGDYDRAIRLLDGRENTLSNRTNFYLCLGDSYYNLGEADRSALYFEKYLHKNPKNLTVLSKLIDIYYEEENHSRTLKYIGIYEENDGDMSNMLFKKAVSLYFVEYYEDAMHVLGRLLGIERKYIEDKGRDYLFGLFVEAFRMDLSDEKVFKVFRSEMEAEDWNEDMVNYLITQIKNIRIEEPSSLCFLGILNKQTGNTERAKTIFKEVLSIDPNHTEALNWLAISEFEMGNKDTAIDIYQKLSLNKKAGKELSYLVATLFIEREDIHSARYAALNAYKKGIHSLDLLKMIGYIFIELKELDSAYEFYLKAQKLDPQNLDVQNQIGVIYLLQGRFNDAAMLFKRIVKKDPAFKEAHYNLGIAYKKMLEEESQTHINKFYELSSGNGKQDQEESFDYDKYEIQIED